MVPSFPLGTVSPPFTAASRGSRLLFHLSFTSCCDTGDRAGQHGRPHGAKKAHGMGYWPTVTVEKPVPRELEWLKHLCTCSGVGQGNDQMPGAVGEGPPACPMQREVGSTSMPSAMREHLEVCTGAAHGASCIPWPLSSWTALS